ncbi:MAG TPA: GDP-mannose 4,6-dehydratase [Patescibacteria group bacterium]|jgi:CDP-paratose 2-epimerase|nr:GDP-mannose 4,6-dehydratase [Patescibacteria group bacterium]
MKKSILIIGGAGFIGINSAAYYLSKGYGVIIFDNFSRRGSKSNIAWFKKEYGIRSIRVIKGDVRYDSSKLQRLVKGVNIVLHLAAQVAVTTSVENPREDFEINAGGTFNVLEALRKSGNNPVLIYSSTNKVYGGLEDLKIVEQKTRYAFKNLPLGVSEARATDFHSPYGCSKGTADQYVRDYSRIYGLNTIVFRQSCIYGPHQFGIEDQGWVAWFIIALTKGKTISIYGNGKQVRDLLFVEDLVRAYDLAAKNIKITKGQIYNVGGGAKNTISIWFDFKPILEKLFGRKIEPKFSDWRPGDQPIYVSDIRKAKKDFGWEPKINVETGIKKLHDWVSSNKELFNV